MRRGDVGQNKVPTFRWPWKPIAPLAPQRTVKNVLNVSSQARTKKTPCKPVEEQNVRLTRRLSAVYPRFITGTASAFRCWLLTSLPTPICLCKPFSCKACPGSFCLEENMSVNPLCLSNLKLRKHHLLVGLGSDPQGGRAGQTA